MSMVLDVGQLNIFLFIMKIVLSLVVFVFSVKYLIGRYKVGVVSLFMLTLFLFSFFYGIQSLGELLLWTAEASHLDHQDIFTKFAVVIWNLAHVGTTISFCAIVMLIVRKKFDVYITMSENIKLKK